MTVEPLTPRVAPPGMALPVPVHVQLASLVLGGLTVLLGCVYVTSPPPAGSAARPTTISELTPVVAWVMVAVGGWVVLATVARAARSSAHGVAAVVHATYCVGLVITSLTFEPFRVTVVSILSVFAVVAHGGACIDYWKRGWK